MGIAHPVGQRSVCRYLQTTGVMVVDVDIGHNLSCITADTFDRLWEIVIDCIRNQSVLVTVFNCLPEILPVSARPQDPLVAAGLNLFDELHDFRNVSPISGNLFLTMVPSKSMAYLTTRRSSCFVSSVISAYLWWANHHEYEFYRNNDL